MQKQRYIVHADMDAFFAAIEQRDNRLLLGKPVVIGADPKRGRGRGVVSTCSYEARSFGIHSAMPISIAYRQCPQAVFLPVDMEKYSAVSERIYEIFYDFTPDIESVSIDEAFLDISDSYRIFGSPLETCRLIKSKIKKETALTVSIGLAPIKMAAKIASDFNKPDGLVEITKDNLLDFLSPLDVDKIWGLGKKTKTVLNAMGIKTIGDLAKQDAKELTAIFGRNGFYFWKLANGIDERAIETSNEAKSISKEITFDEDTSDRQKIESALLSLCEKVSDRLRLEGLKAKTISLKIRLEGFHTYTRSVTIYKATNFVNVIYREVKMLYANFKGSGKRIRLLGVKVLNLIPASFPDSLFKDDTERESEKLHKAVDKIRGKFGGKAIYRAGINNTI
ncbi:MAG: DNA polymerase IV [Candidatus Omnitrophota bacterium]